MLVLLRAALAVAVAADEVEGPLPRRSVVARRIILSSGDAQLERNHVRSLPHGLHTVVTQARRRA